MEVVQDGDKLLMEDLELYWLVKNKKDKNLRISCFGMSVMESVEEDGLVDKMLISILNILWTEIKILRLRFLIK